MNWGKKEGIPHPEKNDPTRQTGKGGRRMVLRGGGKKKNFSSEKEKGGGCELSLPKKKAHEQLGINEKTN